MPDLILIALAAATGSIWRRYLGADESWRIRRPYVVAIGVALALLLIALPAWNLWAVPIALAPVVWLILPAEWSNFWMTDFITKAPWEWPHVPWLLTETAGPRPWAELFCGALGFGLAAFFGRLI